MLIRKFRPQDIPEICAIYNHFVNNTIVTFDEIPLSVEQMEDKLNGISKQFPCLVIENEDQVLGYTYASPWKPKSAYNRTVESTIYIKPEQTSRNLGSQLYTELLNQLKQEGIRIVIAGITIPNPESISFHEKFGFTKVAEFENVGFKFNKWIDVGYWQLDLHQVEGD